MSDETPELGTLYEFATNDPKGNPASTEVGWWTGYAWIACFSDHAWSPEYILSFRRLVVVAETYEPAPRIQERKRPMSYDDYECCASGSCEVCNPSAYRESQANADPVPAVPALDTAVQEATFALARPGSLPKWMEIPALGRNMTPIARVAVAAAYPVIAASVEARTREAIAADLIAETEETLAMHQSFKIDLPERVKFSLQDRAQWLRNVRDHGRLSNASRSAVPEGSDK